MLYKKSFTRIKLSWYFPLRCWCRSFVKSIYLDGDVLELVETEENYNLVWKSNHIHTSSQGLPMCSPWLPLSILKQILFRLHSRTPSLSRMTNRTLSSIIHVRTIETLDNARQIISISLWTGYQSVNPNSKSVYCFPITIFFLTIQALLQASEKFRQ